MMTHCDARSGNSSAIRRRVITCQERHIDDGPQLSECGLSCRPHPHDKVLILVEHNI